MAYVFVDGENDDDDGDRQHLSVLSMCHALFTSLYLNPLA